MSIFTSPEGIDSLGGENTPGAVQNSRVGLVQTALLDHLILNTNNKRVISSSYKYLILDQKLDSLDWGSGGLGDASSHAREHKVLSKSQFLVGHSGGERISLG